MIPTHSYKLEIGDLVFKGDIQLSNAGLVAFKETSDELMSAKYLGVIRGVLEEIAKLPSEYSDLKQFKIVLESE